MGARVKQEAPLGRDQHERCNGDIAEMCNVPGISGRAGKTDMTTILKNLWADQSGASAAEYALILAIVGTAIAGAAIALGGSIGNAMNDAAACIDAGTADACGGNAT